MAARRPPPGKPPGQIPQNSVVPNQTLYVKNLNEKIHRDELKRALYMLFSTYGPVLDIVTMRVGSKGQKMRGQAHIVFRDIQTSTQAMRALQGFDFLGKELVVSYAKGMSHVIPRLRGTFEPPVPVSESTELQKSIFNAPPSSIPTKTAPIAVKPADETQPHGTKRPREEEEQEDEDEDQDDVAMEEDDDDAPMDEDDDDDD